MIAEGYNSVQPWIDELDTGIPPHNVGRIHLVSNGVGFALPNGPISITQANSTGGVKFDQDKPRWSLLPQGVIAAVVRVLTFGAKKYSPDNWKKIEPVRYEDAAMRHFDAWRNGEKRDPETGESHLAHAVCCLLFLLWFDLNT